MPTKAPRNRTSPSGDYRARPRKFRRPRLLIIGCGDIGRRVVREAGRRFQIVGLARSAESLSAIRHAGAIALPAPALPARAPARPQDQATQPASDVSPLLPAGVPFQAQGKVTSAPPATERALQVSPATPGANTTAPRPPVAATTECRAQAARTHRLARWATHILHSAPPPGTGSDNADPLTRSWLNSLLAAPRRAAVAPAGRQRRLGAHRSRQAGVIVGLGQPGSPARQTRLRPPARRLVYLSTTGVYGNRNGQWVSETDAPRPQTARAARRVAAETLIRNTQRRHASRLRGLVLRVPGIYGDDRLPIDRLQQQIPALIPEDDVITNHIHAEDLARIAFTALMRGPGQRTLNAIDDSQLWLGEYLDRVADYLGLPRPPRFSRAELSQKLSPVRMSFMSESRRIRNTRLKRELRLQLRYPTVEDFFSQRRG